MRMLTKHNFLTSSTYMIIYSTIHNRFFRLDNISNVTGSFVLLWRRGSSVLTAGHLKITRDERFKIVDDYNLQISNVRTQDAGDYICQIGDQETRDQVHTVEILGMLKSTHSIHSNEHRYEIESRQSESSQKKNA